MGNNEKKGWETLSLPITSHRAPVRASHGSPYRLPQHPSPRAPAHGSQGGALNQERGYITPPSKTTQGTLPTTSPLPLNKLQKHIRPSLASFRNLQPRGLSCCSSKIKPAPTSSLYTWDFRGKITLTKLPPRSYWLAILKVSFQLKHHLLGALPCWPH